MGGPPLGILYGRVSVPALFSDTGFLFCSSQAPSEFHSGIRAYFEQSLLRRHP